MPRPFSSAPMGFNHDDGTSFMSPYLTPLASQPGTTPCLPYGQRSAPSAAIYYLGGISYVPGGSALRALAPHDTPFTGPRRPDPEEDTSAGLHLRHEAQLATLHPRFFNGGCFGSPSSSPDVSQISVLYKYVLWALPA